VRIGKVAVATALVMMIMAPQVALSASKPDWVAPWKYAWYEVRSLLTGESWNVRWDIREVHDTYAIVEMREREDRYTIRWQYDNLVGTLGLQGFYVEIILLHPPLYGGGWTRQGVENKTVQAGTYTCLKFVVKTDEARFEAWYDVYTGILVYMEASVFGQEVVVELVSTNVESRPAQGHSLPWYAVVAAAVAVAGAVILAVVAVKAMKRGASEQSQQAPAQAKG